MKQGAEGRGSPGEARTETIGTGFRLWTRGREGPASPSFKGPESVSWLPLERDWQPQPGSDSAQTFAHWASSFSARTGRMGFHRLPPPSLLGGP